MVGITSYGVYIPRYRMDRKTIFQAMGWFNGATVGVARGEKAVANYDEDSITMSVAAAMECLNGIKREDVDGLYLSSMSLPYVERQNAAICSAALAFKPDVRSADFGASPKSGTTALLAACEAVQSGNSNNFLVCAADSRLGKPGSGMEHTFGDAAAAFLVGRDDVIAELKGSYSITQDFPDVVRGEGKKFPRTWEERWIRDEGFQKLLPAAITGLLNKCKLTTGDFAKVVIACPNNRVVLDLCKRAGVAAEQIQDTFIDNVGDTGSAMPLLMFASALETAKPGDKILVVSYGSGGDALYFEVTDQIEKIIGRLGVRGHLELRRNLDNYSKYLVFRNVIPVEVGIRGEQVPFVRLSVTHREGQTLSSLRGSQCKACGTPQFPKQRVCINPECGAIDQMDDYYFYDKQGHVNSYTADNLTFNLDPPGVYGLIDFDGGGRLYMDFTDCEIDAVKVGTPVKVTFRRRHVDENRGVIAYYWKVVPA
ncbi:MAG: hydroxymethylglutaryl-CoA synthase [Nitrospirota bacterium]